MKKVPVVISSDNKIFFTVGVVLVSLLENASPETFYEINVLLASDVTTENKEKLLKLYDTYKNMTLNMVDMGAKFRDIPHTSGYHVNYVSAYKMLVPEMFPQYDKVIYLDTDILVRDDLQEFYNQNIGENYIAGVPIPSYDISNTQLLTLLDIPTLDYYINAGVILMNLKKIRTDGIDKQWISLLGSYKGSVDQHILNKVCYGMTCHVPLKYNVCFSELQAYKNEQTYCYYSPFDVRNAIENPSVFHWTGKQKPWIYSNVFLAQEWLQYFSKTPFKTHLTRKKLDKLTGENSSVKRIVSILNVPILKVKEWKNGDMKYYLFGFLLLGKKYIKKEKKMKFIAFKKEDRRLNVFVLGKKIFSHKIRNEFEKIYAKRFKGLTEKELEFCVKEQFKQCHGVYPDLNNPKTFNEKLTWEKLYYKNPLMTICADKVKARDYFCEKVKNGEKYLVKQLGVYDSPDQIDFSKLPKSFVLKSNWGSGCQIIVKNKDEFDINAAKKEMRKWMTKEKNHYYMAFETGYRDITPKIVCEEFLDFEYKLEFFCFNGDPKFFWIVLDDKTKETKANFYKLNWEKLPIENHYPNFNKKIEKAKCYEEVLQNAKDLCSDFPFVRCDFYITKDSYRFSEMTFFHWGASQGFEPVEYDNIIGDMMNIAI